MNACERLQSLLNEYADGELPPDEARDLEAHLEGCPACQSALEELHLLLVRASSLPQGVEPGRDLWPGISGRLAPKETGAVPPVPSVPLAKRIPLWALAAAAALLLAAGAALMLPRRPEPPQTAASRTAPPAPLVLPAAVVRMEEEYGLARADLLALVEARRGSLSPATRAVVDENLALIDRALGNIREALAKDPNNPELLNLLRGTYAQEQDLLRRAASLPADA